MISRLMAVVKGVLHGRKTVLNKTPQYDYLSPDTALELKEWIGHYSRIAWVLLRASSAMRLHTNS